MRELLGEKDNRRLKLIEMIYLEPKINLTVLSDRLYLTPMQLQIDIGFLNNLLSPIEIAINKDKECFVKIPRQLSVKTIYQKFLENSLVFQLIENILFNEHEQYDVLAKNLHISQATLKRTIQFINRIFSNHEMQIKSRPVRIIGNEANIRAFYSFYFIERFPNDEWPLSKQIAVFTRDLVSHFGNVFPDEVKHYANRKRLERYVAISLMRETKWSTLNNKKEDVQLLMDTHKIEQLLAYPNKEKFEYLFKKKLDVALYQRIFYQYFNQRHAFSDEDFQNRIGKVALNQELYQQIEYTLAAISKECHLSVPNKKELSLKLYNILAIGLRITITPYVIYPNRKIFLLFSQPIQERILEQAKQIFSDKLAIISKRNTAYFYEFLYVLVTQWPGFYETILADVAPCRIQVLFNSDVEHAYYIQEHLKFLLGKKIELEVMDVKSLEEITQVKKNCDLLIINFILPDDISPDVPYISIVDALWEDKIRQIYAAVDAIYYKNMRKNDD